MNYPKLVTLPCPLNLFALYLGDDAYRWASESTTNPFLEPISNTFTLPTRLLHNGVHTSISYT